MADQSRLGNDGFWSTFAFNVGTPPQTVYLLPSTLIAETLVVDITGCADSPFSNCGTLRGGLFENSTSSTWDPLDNGIYLSLSIESALGLSGKDGGYYGYDTISLTETDGSDIMLGHQVVGEYATPDLYVGLFGLSPKSSGISSNTSSFVKTLFDQNQIPSLSYSYTAGAYYRMSHGPVKEVVRLTSARKCQRKSYSGRSRSGPSRI